MCEPSSAPSRLSAILRKSSAVIGDCSLQAIGDPIHQVIPFGSFTPALRWPYGLSSGALSDVAPAASALAYTSSTFGIQRYSAAFNAFQASLDCPSMTSELPTFSTACI